MYTTARAQFSESIYIYIDLGSQATLDDNLSNFVLQEFEQQLYERYEIDIKSSNFIKGVYNRDIERFRSGIYSDLYKNNRSQYDEKLLGYLEQKVSDQERHLTDCLHHIVKGRRKQVILVLDNADQRDLDTQQNAFIISQHFAKQTDAVVFLAVRPQTFHQSKRSGAMSAYPQKVFSISPPRADRVLDKRLTFALGMAEGKIPIEGLSALDIHVPSLSTFIKVLLFSLRNNMDLVELLTNITGGNIRAVIDLVKNFIGSPNVNSDKIIDIMEKTGKYIIPVHEFSKSALLGDYSHFDEESSLALNLFDTSFADRKEHFLSALVISFLKHEGAHKNQEGFVKSHSILEEMQPQGFTRDQVEASIRRLVNKKLVETTSRITFDEDKTGLFGDLPDAFRVTTVGVYHVERWAGTLGYLDAMVFDTPIFDPIAMEKISSNPESFDIEQRFNRTVEFKSYLSASWYDSNIDVPYFEWTQVLNAGSDSFISVERFIERKSRYSTR